MEGPNVESRTGPTYFGRDDDRKDRTACFVGLFAQLLTLRYILYKNVNFFNNKQLAGWRNGSAQPS
jgi:hypothetical protein